MSDLQPESTASVPFGESNLEKLKALFPGIFNDGVLDARQLGELLDVKVSGVAAEKESFGLRWAGQSRALESLHLPSLAALRPDDKNSINWDSASNVFVEGDNLEVLKLLRKSYNDQVRLIYIDPPYNTGNDFVYNDDFSDPKQHYLEVTGQIDAEGNKLVANTDVSGRKHSNWLTMMFPRLAVARELLTQDGAIFVSIDDNEVHNLRALMDDLYGPENFIGQFVWAAGRKNDSKFVSTSHEYMVAYARNYTTLVEKVGNWRTRKTGLDEIYAAYKKISKEHENDFEQATKELKKWFKGLPDSEPAKRHSQYSNIDSRGVYFAADISWPGNGGPYFEVLHPSGEPVKLPKTGWRFTQERMNELLIESRIHFGKDSSTVPCIKRYLVDSEMEVPYSVFYKDGRGATKRLREFLGGDFFDFPKDETVIQSIIEFATDKDSLVMDFFAGSGTTAHAVALQNQLDGGNRRYLLVTLNEQTNSKSPAAKEGIETVSEITRLRLKKVVEAFPTEAKRGLRCLSVGSSSFKRFSDAEDGTLGLFKFTLEDDATDDAIAAEIFLHLGVRLDESWTRVIVGGSPAIKSGHVLVVLAREISDEIVEDAFKTDVRTVAFLEDGFAGNDKVKSMAVFTAESSNKTMSTF